MTNWFFEKGTKTIQMGKVLSSTNDVGNTGYIKMHKNEVGPLSHTIYKNDLKMVQQFKYII